MKRTIKSAIAAAVLLGALAALVAPASAAPAATEHKRVIIRNGNAVQTVLGDEPMFFELQGFGGRYIGVALTDLTPELRVHFRAPKDAGVMVSRITPGSPAAKAGIEVGDIITSVDGVAVDSASDIGRAVRKKKEGEPVRIDVLRDGASRTLVATAVERKGAGEAFEINIDPDLAARIQTQTGEAMKKMQIYFDSPEWKARMEKMQDCGRVQERMQELEKRMQELEKKLAK